MFTREIKTQGKTYLNLIESYRENGKTKHRSIGSFGRLDNLRNTEQIRRVAVSLLRYCNGTRLDITTAEEKSRKIWGAPVVIRKLWDEFKLDALFSKITGNRKIKFNFFSSVFLMVLDRLASPGSKLRSYEKQDRYWNIEENELQHLYRAMDILAGSKEEIEKHLFEMNKSLFNMKIDVVFYDVTTLYFESVSEDVLREFGFSKDCKVNEVQIILGLIVDLEGMPIGYDIFPGGTFEGHTVKEAIEKLSKRFQINRLVFVGDRGMLSKDNLELIKSFGYEYIVGSRIKNKTKDLQEKILDEEGYIEVKTEDEGERLKYKVIETGGDRIICGFSEGRAQKDRKDRERLILKAEKIVKEGGSIVSKRGALRYIEVKSVEYGKVDKKRIKEEERWDGYYGVQTNCKSIEGKEVLSIYHELWRIEEAFRVLKSHIEARPIFHWTAKRIKGHMMLCFIAFLIERALEIKLRKEKIEYSAIKIRDALNGLQFSEVEIEGQRFYIRSPVEGLANELLRALKIRVPARVTTTSDAFD
jgi:transposase